jgi:hypothetical protein
MHPARGEGRFFLGAIEDREGLQGKRAEALHPGRQPVRSRGVNGASNPGWHPRCQPAAPPDVPQAGGFRRNFPGGTLPQSQAVEG